MYIVVLKSWMNTFFSKAVKNIIQPCHTVKGVRLTPTGNITKSETDLYFPTLKRLTTSFFLSRWKRYKLFPEPHGGVSLCKVSGWNSLSSSCYPLFFAGAMGFLSRARPMGSSRCLRSTIAGLRVDSSTSQVWILWGTIWPPVDPGTANITQMLPKTEQGLRRACQVWGRWYTPHPAMTPSWTTARTRQRWIPLIFHNISLIPLIFRRKYL